MLRTIRLRWRIIDDEVAIEPIDQDRLRLAAGRWSLDLTSQYDDPVADDEGVVFLLEPASDVERSRGCEVISEHGDRRRSWYARGESWRSPEVDPLATEAARHLTAEAPIAAATVTIVVTPNGPRPPVDDGVLEITVRKRGRPAH